MGVVIIDASTVRAFMSNDEEFNKSVDKIFEALDQDQDQDHDHDDDGVLPRLELRNAFELVDVTTPPDELSKLYASIFDKIDLDNSETVDVKEFKSEIKRIMLDIADRLESRPIQMALEDDGQNFLKKVADLLV